MKDKLLGILVVTTVLATFAAGVFFLDHFSVSDYQVVLISPTEEQVLALYKQTSEQNRFWVRGAHAVKGEHSLIEATIGVRRSDGGEDRVREVLDGLGLEYYLVGRAHSTRG